MAFFIASKSETPNIPLEPTSIVSSSVLNLSALPASTKSWYFALFLALASATTDS